VSVLKGVSQPFAGLRSQWRCRRSRTRRSGRCSRPC
jgi:hypothetical protein